MALKRTRFIRHAFFARRIQLRREYCIVRTPDQPNITEFAVDFITF